MKLFRTVAESGQGASRTLDLPTIDCSSRLLSFGDRRLSKPFFQIALSPSFFLRLVYRPVYSEQLLASLDVEQRRPLLLFSERFSFLEAIRPSFSSSSLISFVERDSWPRHFGPSLSASARETPQTGFSWRPFFELFF